MTYLIPIEKYLCCVTIFLFSFSMLSAQVNGLIVEYDLYEDKVKYIKNGVELEKPNVKKGENIYVIVQEFNPYITRAHLDILNNNYDQYSKSNGSGDSSGGALGFSLTGLLGSLSTGNDITESLNLFPQSRGISSAEASQLQSQFNAQLAKLKNIEAEVNKSAEKLRLFQKAELSRKLALFDIEKLKQNSNIRPSRIRDMISEEIRFAFAKLPGEEINIDDVINDAEQKESIRITVREYEAAINEYESTTSDWVSLSKRLHLLDIDGNERLDFIKTATDSIITVINDNVKQSEFSNLDEIIDLSLEPNLELLAELRQVYEELESINFQHSFAPVQAFSDDVHLKLDFERKDDRGDYVDYKSLSQIIPVTGGWKVSGSVGISFGKLFGERYDYAVESDVIVGNSVDAFVPYLTSYAHFHRQTEAPVNFGASFGLGMPLQTSGNLQSISFFVGPSAYIGQSQKLIITTGLLGAKSQNLGNGYEIGDTFDGVTESLPLSSKYKFGLFFSMSFSIF